MVTALAPLLTPTSLIPADAGYHSERNLQALSDAGREALIADNDMRRRDERFAAQVRHKAAPDPLHDKMTPTPATPGIFPASEVMYDAAARTCICPAGKQLNRDGQHRVIRDAIWERFRGKVRDCGPCPLRAQCIRDPATTKVRFINFSQGKTAPLPETHTTQMKRRIDAPENRARYGQRFGTVEPVFGTLCYNKGLDRFTLRGRQKVDGPWKLFCLVHNIEKLARHGYAA